MTDLKKDVESIQKWFGEVLHQPISVDSRLDKTEAVNLASEYISPSKSISSEDRILIYAQQYWWRLYNVLQEQFPLVLRLFGYTSFNETIAKPFLIKHPPHHWNINYLGEGLVEWLQETYHQPDRELIIAAASIDWSWALAFLSPKSELPTSVNQKLVFAPSTYLFQFKWALFEFRKELLLQQAEYWIENDFPKLAKDKTYYYVLRRTLKGQIKVEELDPELYFILEKFKEGLSVKELCAELSVSSLPDTIRSVLLKPGLLTIKV